MECGTQCFKFLACHDVVDTRLPVVQFCLVSKVLKLKTVVDNCDHVVSEMLILYKWVSHNDVNKLHTSTYDTTIFKVVVLEAENSLSVEPSVLDNLVNTQKQCLERQVLARNIKQMLKSTDNNFNRKLPDGACNLKVLLYHLKNNDWRNCVIIVLIVTFRPRTFLPILLFGL